MRFVLVLHLCFSCPAEIARSCSLLIYASLIVADHFTTEAARALGAVEVEEVQSTSQATTGDATALAEEGRVSSTRPSSPSPSPLASPPSSASCPVPTPPSLHPLASIDAEQQPLSSAESPPAAAADDVEKGSPCCVCYDPIEYEIYFPDCCHRVCTECWKRWEIRARFLPDGATCPECRSGPYEVFFRPPRTREVSEDPSYVPPMSALADAGQTTLGVRTRSQHLRAGLSAQPEESVVMGTSPRPCPTIPYILNHRLRVFNVDD